MGRQDYNGQLHPGLDSIVLFKGTLLLTQSAAAHVSLWADITPTIRKRFPWFVATDLERCSIEVCIAPDTVTDVVLSDDFIFELTDATGAAIMQQMAIADCGQMNHQNGNMLNTFEMPLSSDTPSVFGDWSDWGATETGKFYISLKITYYPALTGADLA